MQKIYLNTNQSEENRIIVTRNGALVEFEQEAVGEENKKGNIYKGVVTNVEPSLEAVFVDFGESKNGLLPLREIPPNAIGVSEGGVASGDKLLVQIKKDNIGDKGAGLTGYISLAGNFLVLMPYREGASGVSSAATPPARREMNELMETLPVPENMSIIARSLAMRHSREDILWDLESYLLPLWNAVEKTAASLDKPALIYRENDILLRVMRDYFRPKDGDVIVCDDEGRYKELCAFINILFPENIGQIQHHDGSGNMVPHSIEQKIEQIYMREVSASSGVRVVFDSTEALVAIDVNSGRQREGSDIEETALKTNLEAAEIIAQQLRLRNLGGLIVIDFIDMKRQENRETLQRRVHELSRKDRARMRMGKISEFGLMEISRQRTSRALLLSQTVPCPRCSGSGQVWREHTFALHMLRKLRTVAFNEKTRTIIMQVPRDTAAFLLNEKRRELQEIEDASGCGIIVMPDNRFAPPNYKLKPIHGGKENAMQSVNQMARQEEAAEQSYKPQAKVHETQPQLSLENMLPDKRLPSQMEQKGGGFLQRLKNLFSGGGDDDAGDKKAAGERRPSRGEQRDGRSRGGRRQSAEGRDGGGRDGREGRESRDGRGPRSSRQNRRGGKGRGGRSSSDGGGRQRQNGGGEQRERGQNGHASQQAKDTPAADNAAAAAATPPPKPEPKAAVTQLPADEGKAPAKSAAGNGKPAVSDTPPRAAESKEPSLESAKANGKPAANGNAPSTDKPASTPATEKPAPNGKPVQTESARAQADAPTPPKDAAKSTPPAAKPAAAAATGQLSETKTVVLPPITRAPSAAAPAADKPAASAAPAKDAASTPSATETAWITPGDKQTAVPPSGGGQASANE